MGNRSPAAAATAAVPGSPTGVVQAISPQGRQLGGAQTCLQHGIKEALPEVGGGGLDCMEATVGRRPFPAPSPAPGGPPPMRSRPVDVPNLQYPMPTPDPPPDPLRH